MRYAKTEVRKHGQKKFETLFSSDVPLPEQYAAVRKLRGSTVHKDYAEVRYFENPRITTFLSPSEAKQREDARKEREQKASAKTGTTEMKAIDAEKTKAKTEVKAA